MGTHHAAGVRVQASRDRHAEITSGTTLVQQGLAATCKDARYKVVESRARRRVGRMSP
jgi:hypothetical protein